MPNMHFRQRVWRACQECRRKKVKCDGEQPCQSCRRNHCDCAYADPSGNTRLADPEYVMRLESRLQWMEQKLHGRRTSDAGEDMSPPVNEQPTTAAEFEKNTSLNTLGDQPSTPNLEHTPISDLMDAFGMQFDTSAGSGAVSSQELVSENIDGLDYLIFDCNEPENHGSASESVAETETRLPPVDVAMLPDELLQVLIDQFYHHIYPIFPIIREPDLRLQLSRRRSVQEDDDGLSLLMYAFLAVSATVLPSDHQVFDNPIVQAYKSVGLGELFYSQASKTFLPRAEQGNETSSVNLVVAQGLLSLYLAEAGRVNEAWVTTGHAIRLYQGLDLDESTDAVEGSDEMRSTHGKLWRCLYILDRSLSTVLSRPMAIDDADCDVELSDNDDDTGSPTTEEMDPWFSIIADFHITMGKIYKSVRSIRKSHNTSSPRLKETLRSRVRDHDVELETYYNKQVLTKMGETQQSDRPAPLQTIAVASYHIGVVLLYRTFIETFTTADMGPEAFLRCAEAASNCIKLTPQVVATVPASHFLVQQSRAIYASAKVLLHCMRLSRNMAFAEKSWRDVESAVDMLRGMKIQWPEIKKYLLLTEEDMRATRIDLDRHDLFHKTFDRYYGLVPSILSDDHTASYTIQGWQQRLFADRTSSHQPKDAPSSITPSSKHDFLYSRRDQNCDHRDNAPPKRHKVSANHSTLASSADVTHLVEHGNNADFTDQSQQFMDFLLPPLTPASGLAPRNFGEMSPMDQFVLPPERERT